MNAAAKLQADMAEMREMGYKDRDIECVEHMVDLLKTGNLQLARKFLQSKLCTVSATCFIDECDLDFGSDFGNITAYRDAWR